MNRPDRDDYVTVNPEQMDLEMWPPVPYNHIQRWRSMSKCPQSQGSGTTPVPFDYLSSKNPLTSQNVDGHAEFAIVVARDRRKQYLFDHRQSSCPDLSHLDIYQVNKGYGCDKRYAEECLKSQGAAPKCLNFGYLKKDCTCACSKYFTGPRCETATNAADSCIKNAWFMEITNVTNTSVYDTVDVGMSVPKEKLFEGYLFNKIYSEFQDGYQYLTITIEPGNVLNHISVTLNFTKMQKVLDRMLNDPHEYDTGQVVIADSPFLHRNFTPPDKLMTQLMGFECGKVVEGFAMLWGAESQNQLRIWCFSSFFLNETHPAMLRSRKAGTFHMVARSGLGAFFRGEPQFSVESLLIRMEVSSFGVPPDDSLSPTNGTDAGGSRSGGGGEESILQHWAEALLSDASPTGLIGAGVVGVILLAGIGVVGFCGRYCHADDGDEDGVSLDRFGENSGDDADDWDSD
ncbi:hypothetical protein FJT64_015608 [Amphibalanus amphitrite]|uniref:EGF-like domain-containing protein n=1 Tax=Amphibalanus amphitrite TaxID=1232801 RepID=A0A6A4XGJ4_AMPAM|nr:hypothetical protein FJT64_015608 [Amphibalanus amphitrite]